MIHTRHTRWSTGGVWKRGFERLADDPDNEYAMIDSTIVAVPPSVVSLKCLDSMIQGSMPPRHEILQDGVE